MSMDDSIADSAGSWQLSDRSNSSGRCGPPHQSLSQEAPVAEDNGGSCCSEHDPSSEDSADASSKASQEKR
eukprot:gene17266-12346_t